MHCKSSRSFRRRPRIFLGSFRQPHIRRRCHELTSSPSDLDCSPNSLRPFLTAICHRLHSQICIAVSGRSLWKCDYLPAIPKSTQQNSWTILGTLVSIRSVLPRGRQAELESPPARATQEAWQIRANGPQCYISHPSRWR
jgi:hypothetical protein